MLRPRFFTRQTLIAGATLALEKEPSRHIARALRMRVGDRLCLFDGRGGEAHGEISGLDRDAVSVAIQSLQACRRESPLQITLAIALSRGDRMDTIIQKATELGVQRIRPLISERAGVRLEPPRLEKKRGHWEKIAISACEQCGRNTLPGIEATVPLTDVLQDGGDEDALRLVLHPGIGTSDLPRDCTALHLLIGPEGGFSDSEIRSAMDAGYQGLELGPRILRTETAPLAAIAVAQARWGDFAL